MSIISSLLSNPRATLMVFLLALPGRLIAISAHECAHAWVAERCGDPTGRMMGRITLNPMKHLDPIGILCMLLLGIGWAKPVPVNPRNFRNYRRDDLLVSIAGVTMNLLLFLLGSLVYYVILGISFNHEAMYYSLFYASGSIGGYLMDMLYYFIATNLSLAIFNLIPVPPLDGYHVLNDLVLHRNLFATMQAQRIGQMALYVAMFSGALSHFLSWAMSGAFSAVGALATAIYRLIGLL
ncbi:MAG: site-2 protease family protein [Clostridia bacterium]|nr:site-2 protease family protein [Clostridia bacterium]